MRERIMTKLVSIKVGLTTKAKINFLRERDVNISEEFRQLVDALYLAHNGK